MILTIVFILLAFLVNLFLPWWSIAIIGVALGYGFNKKAIPAFAWGFLSIFLLWAIHALIIDIQNDSILSSRIAATLGVGSPVLIILATGIIGGLVGGLSTLTGSFINQTEEY